MQVFENDLFNAIAFILGSIPLILIIIWYKDALRARTSARRKQIRALHAGDDAISVRGRARHSFHCNSPRNTSAK
ncbi:MAG TPA: hypothetical protein DCR21_02495 [Succinivibrionaceae bacterium]|nr:hypothetical protein [Succinivibrionaceae bacterium]